MSGFLTVPLNSNANVNGVLSGFRWNKAVLPTLTFSFPTVASAYNDTPVLQAEVNHPSFGQLSAQMQIATRDILGGQTGYTPIFRYGSFSSVIDYTFTEVASPTNGSRDTAIMRMASSNLGNPAGYAYYPRDIEPDPTGDPRGGDIMYPTTFSTTAPPAPGNHTWNNTVHEIGHAMGLKHGHEAENGFAVIPADRDSYEFSIMTYRNYIGGALTGPNASFAEEYGYPQTLMMLDIAALQSMYGANFNTFTGATVYRWDPNTGEMLISENGAAFVGQGRPGGPNAPAGSANRVFLTIWDGNGTDTYDMSNYSTAVSIDLQPGQWSLTSLAQRSTLGTNAGNPVFARGNVFNALQFNGDARSLIENAIGGAAADTLVGNVARNAFTGNGANDSIDGGAGLDTSIYTSTRGAATIARNLNGTVGVSTANDGADTLTNMEWAQFTDGKVWVGAQKNDENNDGRSDIIWQNNSGQAAIWQMDGTAVLSSAALINPGANWRLIGTGDFNGDRKADFLWQNTADGAIAEWLMNGTTLVSGVTLANPGTAWKPITAADFNGDGISDVALQHADGTVAVWTLNGTGIAGAGVLANPGTSWKLSTAADFDLDGTADMVFQNVDGALAVWRVNGTSLVSGAVLPNPGAAWSIKGTGDFNNDSRPDIVWQNIDGSVAVWSMADAANLLTGPTTGIVASPGSNWLVGSVGDFNGDGVADIALQNKTTGQEALWMMNGANLNPTGSLLPANPGTAWHMVA